MDIVQQALKVLEERLSYNSVTLTEPDMVRDYLRLKLAPLEHEEFYVVWLTAQQQVIKISPMFRGSITESRIHPREIIKEGLAVNAAACIFAHNHPSGIADPSRSDFEITKALKTILDMIDIRLWITS